MPERIIKPIKLLLLLFLSSVLISAIHLQSAVANSSCIDCHTDEVKLTQSLSKDTAKKSSMTSGTG
ncbi:MAG: hypothetical protein B1H11_08975 [Desulfobacteraceae bacterium 4484_190.1]|nr:MAG: hypothetical protein B1H11_08975 [Desulfobacteraceae bacterium 4484_190.1]